MKISIENYLSAWFRRCMFALLFLTSCRILFIIYLFPYLNGAPNAQLPAVFLTGVLFDIQALAIFLSVFHLLSLLPFDPNHKRQQIILKFLFMTGLGLMILLNFIDMEFFKIKTRRSGIELFQLVSDKSNPVMSYIYNYWWLSVGFIVAMILVFRFYPKQRVSASRPRPTYILVSFLLMFSVLFIGARGGFYTRPFRSFDAARFVDPRWVPAAINSPTQLITSVSSAVPQKLSYMSDRECQDIVNPVKRNANVLKTKAKPNLVLIILESFGRDYCGFLNKEDRFTPFLDQLSKESMVFVNAYSNGTTSIESIPAIFASIPSLLEVPYINSNFQNNDVRGAHYYLSRNGYDCSFYYGAENGSMGFDNFLLISGRTDYSGRNEYPSPVSDYDGHWGIWDEPYLNYFAGELSRRKKPFFSTVFTLTSHDPYRIPDSYKDVFRKGDLPIHETIGYADHALRQFFEKARRQPWFDNTIFIITGDHPSHSQNEYYYTPTGKYEIPMLIYAPKLIPAGINDSSTVSHLDIMPTLLGLGQVKEPFFAMGRSLLDTGRHIAVNRDHGVVQVIEYPYCLRLFPTGFKMHVQPKYTPNELVRYELTEEEKIIQKRLEKELLARLQLYNNSLLNNTYRVD
jgi:phosphoglycerol transferase MdoB-like AlkP superfamily enzyme